MLMVIGTGFGRTGTASAKTALEELGFGPCYHMYEVMGKADHIEQWRRAGRGEPVDWHTLFANYQSSTDWPACNFWDRQMEAFPQAKVLLTMRDPDSWYDSVANTIYAVRSDNPRFLDMSGLPAEAVAQREGFLPQLAMIDEVIWKGTFDGRFGDRAHAIIVYNAYVERVKRTVPAERLLAFDVKQGWEPLCAFLEVAVPDKPFPHVNDTASQRALLTQLGFL
jgi:hypothetical protein